MADKATPAPSMDLRTFVTTTLVQIVGGVQDAHNQIAELETTGAVNPVPQSQEHGAPQPVEFDVAVTVASSGQLEGGARLQVMGFALGGKASTDNSTQAVSRVRFGVPVAMPITAKDKHKRQPVRANKPDYGPWGA